MMSNLTVLAEMGPGPSAPCPSCMLLTFFSCSVVSNSLQPHLLQHARPPCLLLSPSENQDTRPSPKHNRGEDGWEPDTTTPFSSMAAAF